MNYVYHVAYFVQCFFVPCTPVSGLEQNNVLIGAGICYQMNPVPDLHDTRTRNRRQKDEVDLWRRFLVRVSWVTIRYTRVLMM